MWWLCGYSQGNKSNTKAGVSVLVFFYLKLRNYGFTLKPIVF